jgi:ureidoglycolate amidohydrolase
MCDVFPGAVNSVPARVRLSVDIRDTDLQRRDGVIASLKKACEAVAAKRQVSVESELLNADAPAECDSAVIQALREGCEKHSCPFLRMTSRAYHDSLFMSRIAPTAMLFIPCRNGYSHRPDEYASPDDIARGTLVLAEALATLAG